MPPPSTPFSARARCLRMFLALWTTVALLLAADGASAQTPDPSWLHGRIIGAVAGAGIPNAAITLKGPVSVTVLSDSSGAWRAGPLPAGTYVLAAEHIQFASLERTVDVDPNVSHPGLLLRMTPRPVSLDALVVTAGRRVQRLADATVATELVSRREIEQTGASDLASVLTERTGVQLAGGHPVGAGLMIQGMDSERVLVLVDGQPFIGRIAGAIDVSRIPTSMVERVEIVKGPQSTLYGSEAMGGVVNVITRQAGPSAWDLSTAVTAGEQGRLDVNATATTRFGDMTAVADVGRRAQDLTPGLAADDGTLTERWNGLARLAWETPVDGLRMEASGFLIEEDQRWRSGQAYQFADNTQWSGRLTGVWTSGRHRLTPTFTVTAFDHLSRRSSAEAPAPGGGELETQRLAEGELLYGFSFGPHALNAGVEVRRDAIHSDRISGTKRVDHTVETFVQTSLSFDRFTLVPGVRLSSSDLWGTHWTPRLAAMYRPVPELALRLSAGEGFRAPSFKETYLDHLNVVPGFAYTVRGNPDLDPEISRNVTAGVEWAGERLYARLQVFDNHFDDFIETRALGDSSGVAVFTYGNIEGGLTRGAELEAGVTYDAWRVEAGYGLLRSEREDTGEPLLGRPRSTARMTLIHGRPDGLRGSLTALYTGRTPMARGESGTEWRDGFVRFDARLAKSLPLGLELTVGVDNLFDSTAEAWPGFTGRHVYTSVSWRMSADGEDG